MRKQSHARRDYYSLSSPLYIPAPARGYHPRIICSVSGQRKAAAKSRMRRQWVTLAGTIGSRSGCSIQRSNPPQNLNLELGFGGAYKTKTDDLNGSNWNFAEQLGWQNLYFPAPGPERHCAAMQIHRPATFVHARSTDNGAHPGDLEARAQQRRCPTRAAPFRGIKKITGRWP